MPAHKFLLFARCEYFRRMFTSGYAEAAAQTVRIEGVSHAAFKQVAAWSLACDDLRSPEITRDHPRWPEMPRDAPRCPEMPRDHPRSPEITRGQVLHYLYSGRPREMNAEAALEVLAAASLHSWPLPR